MLPRNHYDYAAIDDPATLCECILCVNYRITVAPFLTAMEVVFDHRLNCHCTECKNKRKWETISQVADAKRNVWSANTYLVKDKYWREHFLTWLEDRILNDDWTVVNKRKNPNYFWVHDSESLETRWWLENWYEETHPEESVSAFKLLGDNFVMKGLNP